MTGAVLSYGVFSARSSMFGPVTCRGVAQVPARIALTFDDGPHPQATGAICQVLAKHDVAATFFMVGANVAAWPDVVRQVHAGGHLIGSHSFDHAYAGMFHGRAYWDDQLQRTSNAIEKIITQRPLLFRPPMGFKHPPLMAAVRAAGQHVVTWSRRAFDGVRTTSHRIHDRLGPRAVAGDILLLHDGAPPGRTHDPQPTVDALDQVITTLKSRGMQLVRLDELIEVETSQSQKRAEHV